MCSFIATIYDKAKQNKVTEIVKEKTIISEYLKNYDILFISIAEN